MDKFIFEFPDWCDEATVDAIIDAIEDFEKNTPAEFDPEILISSN